MKFRDYPYTRPDMDALERLTDDCVAKIRSAQSAAEQIEQMEAYNKVRMNFNTQSTLISIRYSQDTTNEQINAEREFMDVADAKMTDLLNRFYRAVTESKFRPELEKHFSPYYFEVLDGQLKTFHPDILPDIEEENRLTSQYIKLRSSAKIPFDGEERSISEMGKYYESKDRAVRKAAQEAVTRFYEEHESEFDDIYDQLVKVRDRMAKTLGFENFVPLGYLRMQRIGYTPSDVAVYRNEVLKHVVPAVAEFEKAQAKRLGLESLKYYDDPLMFLDGNADPQGPPEWILEHGKQMYHELSPETREFIDFMIEHELLDLVARKGKAGGGYCTFLPDYHAPFIFSNFNGTSGDVDVLTHEAGHAFYCFLNRYQQIPEFIWTTYEAAEIHSMSMEFLTYPWMERFFEQYTDKYKYNHIVGAVSFLPYGVLVDEFQHAVYENPAMTPAERKATWAKLHAKYLPGTDYEDNAFLKKGGYWFRQGHIFEMPFYYIDYTLAQVCAFQFFVKSRADRKQAWEDYLRLCRAGGSKPFLELVDLAGLESPFREGMLESIIPPMVDYLKHLSITESAPDQATKS
ncbi:MAG: M3 family oligoendopeptidase [Bacillota bacterium]|nr:M3 family oligoendopeptidase [Bacillota bacterium]